MLRTLRRQGARVFPSSSRARRRQERAWLQWPVRHRPFASPAPGRGVGAPRPPIPLPRRRSASAASILHRHLPHQPGINPRILPPYALRAGRFVCDSLWPGKPSTKSQEPPLQGRFNLAAIPPHLVTFPPPCGPRHASATAPATLRSVLGSKATKCSGQPGYGRPGR